MLRRLALMLMLLASLALQPLAQAGPSCCDGGCDQAMPACASLCAGCAAPVTLPAAAPALPAALPAPLLPAAQVVILEDWIDEIWQPPD